MSKNGATAVFIYVDNILTLGKLGSDECHLNLTIMLGTLTVQDCQWKGTSAKVQYLHSFP